MKFLRLGLVLLATTTILAAADSLPGIISQSSSRTLTEGENTTLSVEASGTAPLTFAWSQDGQPIPGATSSTLTLDPATTEHTGLYTVAITNPVGSVTSPGILLDVLAATAPSVSLSPALQTRNYGDYISFNTNLSGSNPITFQWYKDGAPIPNATHSGYSISNATESAIGRYHVVVTNVLGTVTSNTIEVRLNPPAPPRFTVQPVSVVVNQGNTASFNLNTAGTEPLTYQLLRDHSVIRTATSAYDLRLPNAQPSDEGYYQIRLTNAWGEATSDLFRIVVDTSSSARSVTVFGPNDPLRLGDSFSLNASISGSGPYVYQWLRNGQPIEGATSTYYSASASLENAGAYSMKLISEDGVVESNEIIVSVVGSTELTLRLNPASRVYTPGTYSDMFVSVYGAGQITYQWYRNDVAIPGATSSTLQLNNRPEGEQVGSYTVTASNGTSSVTSEPAVVTLATEYAPVITQQPSKLLVRRNYNTTLFVSALGNPSPTYQWYRDNQPISGATNDSYYIDPNNAAALAGDYHVVVTNRQGSATSSTATVTAASATALEWKISYHPEHFSLLPGDTRYLSVGILNSSSNLSYQWFHDGTPITNATGSNIYVAGEPANAGAYHVVVSDGVRSETSESAHIGVTLRRDQPLVVQSSASGVRTAGEYRTLQISLRNGLTPDHIIWKLDGTPLVQFSTTSISLSGNEDLSGTYTAEVTYGDDTVTIPAIHMSQASSTGGSDFAIASHPRSTSVTTGGSVQLSIETTVNSAAFQWFKDGVAIPLATSSFLNLSQISATHAGDYTVQVTYGDQTLTSEAATISLRPAIAPEITLQPRDLVITPSDYSVSLQVQATGNPAPSVQWYRNGTLINGATGYTYYLNDNNTGSYYATLTNAAGTVTSRTAQVGRIDTALPPTITAQPASATVSSGAFVQFNATATGTAPLNYQWYFDGDIIPGAQASSHSIAAATTADIGRYQLRVSDGNGVTFSRSAFLEIGEPALPTFLTHPASRTVEPGATTLFSVNVESDSPVSYQWKRNGADLFAQTAATLTLNNVGSQHVGLYTVTVTNDGGSVTSQGGRLDLAPANSPAFARHRLLGNGYEAGDTVTVIVRITYSGSLSALGYQVLLPAGWTFASDTTTDTAAAPRVDDEDLLEWAWTDAPTSPFEFRYVLNVPAEATTAAEISAMVEARAAGELYQSLANPEPLIIDPAADRHSADTNQDGRLDLTELLRVIELYNTRHGNSRTGRYESRSDTVDGFAPDSTQPATVASPLLRHHMADTDRDGHLSLSELLRVIELYNTRAGSTRTGAYHRAAGSADGFAPGEAP